MSKMGTGAYIVFKTIPFDGYKTGLSVFRGKKAVAIPRKQMELARDTKRILMVMAKNDPSLNFMEFDGTEPPLMVAEYESKWKAGDKYQLYYYVWNPNRQFGLFEG